MQIILGLLLILVVFFLLNNAFGKSSGPSKKTLVYIALTLAGLVLLMLVVTGRLHILAALGAGLLMLLRQAPWILRSLPLIKRFMGSAQAATGKGQQSTLDTSLVRMSLDHATGDMDGQVIAGTYTGQRLSTMSVDQLAQLYRSAVSGYTDAVEVLETYFERTYGVHWRSQFDVEDIGGEGERRNHGSQGAMSVADACDILGLEQNCTEQEVREAHRRMMQKFHPDRGGSNYLAARINEAKQVLLDKLRS